MKKSLLYCLICMLVFSSVSVCYADSNGTMTYSKSQIEGVIEKTAGAECIVKDYQEDPESYVVENTDSTISIPKDSANAIVFNSKGNGSIGLGFPQELVVGEGQLCRNGTVLYESTTGNVNIGVQALSRTESGLTFNAVRALVTIMDSSAPHDYSFKLDMPNGYRMVWDYDYNDGQDFLDDGTIFILDENDEIVKTIDPAWAKDRDGNEVETYYTIKGSTLVQHVSFDKNTKFPVVADPTEGDTKIVTKYLKKARVKAIRDSYAGQPATEFWEDVINLIGGTVPGLSIVWTIATFMGNRISATKYSTWNKLYTQFPADKNRVKMVLKYRWHHKGAWVATGAAKYSYVTYV